MKKHPKHRKAQVQLKKNYDRRHDVSCDIKVRDVVVMLSKVFWINTRPVRSSAGKRDHLMCAVPEIEMVSGTLRKLKTIHKLNYSCNRVPSAYLGAMTPS